MYRDKVAMPSGSSLQFFCCCYTLLLVGVSARPFPGSEQTQSAGCSDDQQIVIHADTCTALLNALSIPPPWGRPACQGQTPTTVITVSNDLKCGKEMQAVEVAQSVVIRGVVGQNDALPTIFFEGDKELFVVKNTGALRVETVTLLARHSVWRSAQSESGDDDYLGKRSFFIPEIGAEFWPGYLGVAQGSKVSFAGAVLSFASCSLQRDADDGGDVPIILFTRTDGIPPDTQFSSRRSIEMCSTVIHCGQQGQGGGSSLFYRRRVDSGLCQGDVRLQSSGDGKGSDRSQWTVFIILLIVTVSVCVVAVLLVGRFFVLPALSRKKELGGTGEEKHDEVKQHDNDLYIKVDRTVDEDSAEESPQRCSETSSGSSSGKRSETRSERCSDRCSDSAVSEDSTEAAVTMDAQETVDAQKMIADVDAIDSGRHKERAVTPESVTALDLLKARGIFVDSHALLGFGGFGSVYRGTYNGHLVAVKVMQHKGYGHRVASNHVPFEVILNKQISHKNLVQVLYSETCKTAGCSMPSVSSREGETPEHPTTVVCQDDDNFQTCIVMEYCDLGTLFRAVRHGLFFEDSARTVPKMKMLLKCAMDVVSVMLHLHEENVIHGDLKPENVLLKSNSGDPRGFICKVGDLGLSREFNDSAVIHTNTFGTVTHMPPELLEDHILTPASDVYSFGMLLWQLASGRVPFQGYRAHKIMKVVVQGYRPQMPDHTPPGLAALVRHCWHHTRERRPSFRGILLRLKGLLADQQAVPKFLWSRPPERKHRRRGSKPFHAWDTNKLRVDRTKRNDVEVVKVAESSDGSIDLYIRSGEPGAGFPQIGLI